MINLINDDCLNALKHLDADSIDSLVTDPPAGISFMGKEWDSDKGGRDGWIAWMTEVMRECHRVLKPGAHGLVWAIPRTSHWTSTALENAGFEVRDVVTHLFGSGFPKSLDISKVIDKASGAERKVIGINPNHRRLTDTETMCGQPHVGIGSITVPSTDSAKQWQGWGTALKPASEHWVLVRKPLGEKTVAANVLKHGTGGINIDASRVGVSESDPNHRKPSVDWQNADNPASTHFGSGGRPIENLNIKGRFPANLVLSHSQHCQDDQCDIECAILQLDAQSLAGGMHSAGCKKQNNFVGNKGSKTVNIGGGISANRFGDSGGASRFFYCAKISTSERNAGANNNHPTVKPKKLMSYFCKMITPPEGIVLDPFMGSGSTGIAAKECGFKFIGIERETDYFEIASKRIKNTD